MNEHQSATTGWFIGGLIGLLIIATCFVLLHRDYEEDNKKTVLIYVDEPEVAADGVVSAQRVYKVKKRNYMSGRTSVILIEPEDEFGNKYEKLIFTNRKVTIEEK